MAINIQERRETEAMKTIERHSDATIDTQRRRLIVGLALLGVGGLGAVASAQTSEQVIRVVAKRFDFTPNKIQLKKGVPVVLEFTTLDVPMGFNLPDFKVRTDILPDKVSRVRLVPDKTGTFDFVCDIFCGSGHESMEGTIVVT
jgi:cytochrome c oxidase subunit 2